MKICTKCKQEIPKSEFRIDKHKKDDLYSSCKTCCKIIEQQRYLKNKQSIQQKRKASYNDEAKAKKAKYDKTYRTLKGEERLKSKRDYYHNKGGKEKKQQWISNNPLKAKAYSKQERAVRSKLKKKSSITATQMYEWLLAQVYICPYCGISCPTAFHVDHIDPLSKGGLHEFSNLTISCIKCNQSKYNKSLLLWYATNRSG